ncbi:E3 ubiquitin-protein ligase CHFR-like isoform X2 [Adelges cooleyi]|uniref:E3 ubiquitin-protein ligase CHFR-like isoform X2 n=1 Tax=Adelges cooleyi TaxID=133065 RepID=UPI00217F8B26|nr:E3 ubiquitin-protein ligase CHFR-like isoform X2 [Adelges cooleyi]
MSSICMYYRRGTCRFGDRCWNSHDLDSGRSDRESQPDSSGDEIIVRPPSSNDSPTSSIPRSRIGRPSSNDSRSTSIQKQIRRQFLDAANKFQRNQNNTEAVPKPNIWSLSNKESGETREGSPDSMLVEAVKKLNEAENEVRTLRQQLCGNNDGESFSWVAHQLEQAVDSDLQCNICYEMFIKPTVLNCSHTFCHDCIDSWTRRVNHCPTCRVYVKSKSHCLTLDSFLDKISEHLPDEVKQRRENLKVERNNSRVNRNRRANNRRRNNRGQSVRRTLGMIWGDRGREGAEWNFADTLFDPIRLGDVLGRNRNEREDLEWDDNLSDSSMDSINEFGYRFCSYCDNTGHSSANCPLALMEESDEWYN